MGMSFAELMVIPLSSSTAVAGLGEGSAPASRSCRVQQEFEGEVQLVSAGPGSWKLGFAEDLVHLSGGGGQGAC